jgi:hypothetical protein
MNKKIILRIITGVLATTIFFTTSSCRNDNGNANIQAQGSSHYSEVVNENNKDIAYYESILLTSEPKMEYLGTYKLNNFDFIGNDNFSKLADSFMLLEYYKNKKLNPFTEATIYSDHWDSNTYILVENRTNKELNYYDCNISGFNVLVTNETRLYDIIGEQIVAIPENYNFVESMFFVFGCPDNVTTTDKTIDTIYHYNTQTDNGDYIKGEIKFTFNNETNVGNLLITFE